MVKRKAAKPEKAEKPEKRDYKLGEDFPEHIHWIRNRLRLFREKRGFTQTQLADRIGAVRGRVTDMERSEKKLADFRLGTLFRFLKGLGVSPEKFFEGAPGFGIPAPSSVIITNESDVVDALSPMLNEAQIKRVLTFLRKEV